MDAIKLLRWRNRWMGHAMPDWVARRAAREFLTPRQLPPKAWESKAEESGAREWVNQEISVLRWPVPAGHYAGRVLLVHGWESRATQMYGFVADLLDQGLEVLAMDAPAHGASAGQQSDPWRFTQAVLQVQQHYGPLQGTIGHSMGGAAVALAAANGLHSETLVLIAAPVSITDTLRAFAHWTHMPPRCQKQFMAYIENEVGMPPQELNVARALRAVAARTLFIHDRDDQETSYENAHQLAAEARSGQVWITQGLGHRKLMRSVEVHHKVAEFVAQGSQAMPGVGVANGTAELCQAGVA